MMSVDSHPTNKKVVSKIKPSFCLNITLFVSFRHGSSIEKINR